MEVILASALARWASLYDRQVHELIGEYTTLQRLYRRWRDGRPMSSRLVEILNRCWTSELLNREQAIYDNWRGGAVVTGDVAYPPRLTPCDDRPYVLYYIGDIALAQGETVSIVGTRKMTTYGKRAVERLVGSLSGSGLATVSGLALGIDACVHRASLDSRVATIAVLGGGLDRFEPLTNAKLAQDIIASGGLLLSEYPPGVRPAKHHFLARNRIIAGLSKLTVVVEGETNSGSLKTAALALGYGRDVGAVPGDIFSPTSQGPHALLEDGAVPVCHSRCLLGYFGLNKQSSASPVSHELAIHLSRPATFDELCQATGIDATKLQVMLAELEISGFIQRTDLGQYYLA